MTGLGQRVVGEMAAVVTKVGGSLCEGWTSAWAVVEVQPLGAVLEHAVTRSLDVLGFYCPVPVARTRRAVADMAPGDVLEVWADDPETLHDMPVLCDRVGLTLLSVETEAGAFRFLLRVGEGSR